MPVDVTFSEYPPSPFGTTGYFEFCERIPLECGFSFDEWQGPQENPSVHLGSLLQHLWHTSALEKLCKPLSRYTASQS